jgi:hypothetical protein
MFSNHQCRPVPLTIERMALVLRIVFIVLKSSQGAHRCPLRLRTVCARGYSKRDHKAEVQTLFSRDEKVTSSQKRSSVRLGGDSPGEASNPGELFYRAIGRISAYPEDDFEPPAKSGFRQISTPDDEVSQNVVFCQLHEPLVRDADYSAKWNTKLVGLSSSFAECRQTKAARIVDHEGSRARQTSTLPPAARAIEN